MTNENYMVVQLPKENSSGHITIGEMAFFEDYNKAFDCLNALAAAEGMQLKQPRKDSPIRVALHYINVELWVVKRTEELFKN
jgi:hypothetical protein